MRIGILGLMESSHPYLAARTPPGVELVPFPPRIAAFPHTPYERLVVDLAHVDAAERAAAAGVDAIMIDSTCDWGIDAIRAAVTVPVVGAGEVGITEASEGGRRFSVVTIWPPSLRFLYDERLRAVPGGELCTSVRYVSCDDDLARLGRADSVVARMERHEQPVVERIAEECRRSVADDRAEAVFLGCTCMAGVAAAIEERLPGVPIVEGSRSALAAALRAVPVAPAYRSAMAGFAPQLVDALLGSGAPPALPATEKCEVCVAVEDEAALTSAAASG